MFSCVYDRNSHFGHRSRFWPALALLGMTGVGSKFCAQMGGIRPLTPPPWAFRVTAPLTGFFSTSRALIPTPNGVLLFCHAPKCGGVFGVGIGSLFLMVTWPLA